MRFIKIAFYVLVIIVLQTVIFSRLSYLGVVPDLVLVSVIAFAIREERRPATFFSAAAGFLQDIFSAGIYLNTIIKVLVSNAVSTVKEEFLGDEYSLMASMVAFFTPLVLVVEAAVFYFLFKTDLNIFQLLFRMVAATICNLLLVPILFPIVKGISREEKE